MESEAVLLRVAVDTNVLLSGIIWPRWPNAVLQHALHGDFRLVLPQVVILEARRNMQRRFPEYLEDFKLFLSLTDYELVPVPSLEAVHSAPALMRQAEDIPVALSVMAAKVDYFVTSDKDFTDLHPSTQQVRAAIPGILLPAVFLRDVMQWSSEQLEAIRHRTWSDLTDTTASED